ncbi:MAG: TIM barrel protein [Bacteroidota bacterium]|nr:TIM barrel protein [Bacteroidota bacterium]
MKQNRRKFITTIAAAGAAIPFISAIEPLDTSPVNTKFPIHLFSKPLDAYEFDFMCECLVKSGIGGFDLTVRPKGKAEPAYIDSVLPRMVEEAKKYNIALDMMVTGILSASDPMTEKILKTASGLGIRNYRLGWFEYDNKTGILESLKKYKAELRAIAELNRKFKIHGDYQNHSGTMVGGPVWDLYELLHDIPAELIGSQYDVRHATVEGASSWILGMRLIADHIRSLAIKDFTWLTINGKPQAVTVPLGEGMVDWDLYFSTIKELNISGPITLHIEYPLLAEGEEKLPLSKQQDIIVLKLRKDMDFLKGYLNKFGLV